MEYKKITEVELIEEPSEGATVLAEDNGQLRRVPYKNVGGGGGIPTAIIKSSDYDDTLASLQTGVAAASAAAETWECINMTFEEAYEIMASGQPLQAAGMVVAEGCATVPGIPMFAGSINSVPCVAILIASMSGSITLYWTADGLSTEAPSSGK